MTQHQPPDPLPYRPPPPYASDHLAGLDPLRFEAPFIATAVALPLWLFGAATMVFFVFVLPKFEQIFKDFRVEMPWPTKILLSIGRWIANDYGWVFAAPAVAALPLLVCVILQFGSPTRDAYLWRRRWASLLAVLFIGGVILLVGFALFAPMISLIQSVSGGSSKK